MVFSKLGETSGRLRGEESQHLKLAASAAVLTKHLPDLLERMRGEFPELKLTLRDAVASTIDELLLNGEVDVAVSVLHGDNAPGVKTMDLLKLPLVLVVPKTLKAKSFEALVEEVHRLHPVSSSVFNPFPASLPGTLPRKPVPLRS